MQTSKMAGARLDLSANLLKWQAFFTIAQLGSLKRTALQLGTTQPLLSRQISSLEQQCGMRLFDRTGRGLELSEAGERIFPQVKALLAQAEQLELEIRGEAQAISGDVTLALMSHLAPFVVRQLLPQVRERYPGVRLKMQEGSSGKAEEWAAEGNADIALLYRYGPSLPDGEEGLATVDVCLIGAKGDRLTSAGTVPLRILDELPLILPGLPNGLRRAVDHLARVAGINIKPALQADSLPSIIAGVQLQRLYAIVPLSTVWAEVSEGRLQASRIVDPTFQTRIAMMTAKSKGPGKAVSTIAALIVDIITQMEGRGLLGPRSQDNDDALMSP